MSCQSFCNSNQYRRLCSYDAYHQECKSPLQQHSFGCKSVGDKKMCVELNKAPGVDSYSTIEECQSKCNNLSPHSFECIKNGYGNEINYNCTLQNLPPNNDPSKGPIRYSNAQACQSKCNKRPLGQQGYNCVESECELVKGPKADWKYSNLQDCIAQCNPSDSGPPGFSYF